MKDERIKQYAFKVTQANKTQLVVIVYDIILEDLKSAREFYEAGDLDAFVKDLKHAQMFVVELMSTVDCKYQIGLDLMSLYLYVNKQIISAIVQRKPDRLSGLDDIIERIRSSFDIISRTDYSEAVMSDTEQVYAGLTYNKKDLSESYLSPNQERRGFTV